MPFNGVNLMSREFKQETERKGEGSGVLAAFNLSGSKIWIKIIGLWWGAMKSMESTGEPTAKTPQRPLKRLMEETKTSEPKYKQKKLDCENSKSLA